MPSLHHQGIRLAKAVLCATRAQRAGALLAVLAGAQVFGFTWKYPQPGTQWNCENAAGTLSQTTDVMEKTHSGYRTFPLTNTVGNPVLTTGGSAGQKELQTKVFSGIFTIDAPYLNFGLLAIGNEQLRVGAQYFGVRLWVEGTPVRAAGAHFNRQDKQIAYTKLCWDVREFLGKRASIEVTDDMQTAYLRLDAPHFSTQPEGFVVDALVRGKETYRPVFHLTSPYGWLNDPNGLFYLNGIWTAFHQTRDAKDHTYWRRAVSTDLVTWQAPPPAGDEFLLVQDGLSYWSGSVWVDEKNRLEMENADTATLLAFYTLATPEHKKARQQLDYCAHHRRSSHFPQWHQPPHLRDIPQDIPFLDEKGKMIFHPEWGLSQHMAYSLDGGQTWTPYTENPILPAQAHYFDRDPKVFFYAPSNEWFMWLHTSYNNSKRASTLTLFRSSDLKKWEKIQEISDLWECPDFFELPLDGDAKNKRWVLVHGTGDYFVGRFDREGFTAQARLQPGREHSRVYASQTFENAPEGRRVQLFWLQATQPDAFPSMPFVHQMTFPVELTLKTTPEGPRLFTNPVKEIEAYQKPLSDDGAKNFPKGVIVLKESDGALLDLELSIDVKNSTASEFSVVIGNERLSYNLKTQTLKPFKADEFTLAPEGDTLHIRILRDKASLEAFFNHGQKRNLQSVFENPNPLPQAHIEVSGGTLTLRQCRLSRLDISAP